MIAKFIQGGDAIDYTPATAVAAGDVIQLTDLVGVAKLDIPAGKLGALSVVGVFDFPKSTGAGQDIALGARLYWDAATNKVLKAQVAGEPVLGKAVAAAGESDLTVRVRLEQ